MFSRGVSLTVSIARALYAAAILSVASDAVVVVFATIEATMAAFSIVNALIAKEVDATWRGYVALSVYAFGFMIQPQGSLDPWMQALLWCVVYLRAWSLVTLGLCVTCGVTTYVTTVESGPYAYVRHPMQLSGVLARLVFWLAWPTPINLAGLVMMAAGSALIVMAEESFLKQMPAWRDYAAGVRYRLIPYVW